MALMTTVAGCLGATGRETLPPLENGQAPGTDEALLGGEDRRSQLQADD